MSNCQFCGQGADDEFDGALADFYRPTAPDGGSVLAHADCLPDDGLDGGEWAVA